MLLTFRIENYKSYKNITEFSMKATKLKNLSESNTFSIHGKNLLKSAVIYGSNASGKSNLLEAIKDMKMVVMKSTDMEISQTWKTTAFVLSTETEKSPSIFEVDIIIDNFTYRYGFSIYDEGIIGSEWFKQKELKLNAKWQNLFSRDIKNIKIGTSFNEGKKLEDKTRKDALFLTVVAEFNGDKSTKILDWFKRLNICLTAEDIRSDYLNSNKLNDTKLKNTMVSLVKNADIGIVDIVYKNLKLNDLNVGKEDINKMPDFLIKYLQEDGLPEIRTTHIQYNQSGNVSKMIDFRLWDESTGTKKLIEISVPILNSLESGHVLIVDELDSSMHTELTKAIIKLFNSKETNPNNAQLIFTTHDTNLLNQEFFRRDQIWFTEKDIYGVSDLYSLIEYGRGKTRDDLALEKNYLNGKFGAIPNISSLIDEDINDGE